MKLRNVTYTVIVIGFTAVPRGFSRVDASQLGMDAELSWARSPKSCNVSFRIAAQQRRYYCRNPFPRTYSDSGDKASTAAREFWAPEILRSGATEDSEGIERSA
jgi:hypothetical protein